MESAIMVGSGTQFELRVLTRLSQAAIATFGVARAPTVVPRNTVYRLRVPADRDPTEVLQRLTEHNVQVLEIRRCAEPGPEHVAAAADRPAAAPPEAAVRTDPESGPECGLPPVMAVGVVIPFPHRGELAAD